MRASWDSETGLPPDYVFETDEGSVTFRHFGSHADNYGCADCHPEIFAMSPGGMPSRIRVGDDGVHESNTCFRCHNGDEAFGTQESEDSCSECHSDN